MEYTHVIHTFEPVYDDTSKILILGSFPSVKSREQNFYYGHPQNRFWKVLAGIFGGEVPQSIEEKKIFLLKNHIAVWDVIASCDIVGSSDSSIKNVVGNDMNIILKHAPVERIFTNGDKAYQLYLKHYMKEGVLKPEKLPSTSPANAAWKLDRLIETWKKTLMK